MSNRHKALKKTESNPPLRGARGVFSLKIRFPLPEDTPLRPPQGGIFSGLLILLLLLCFHVPANAYIMEGQAVLKQMLQKLGTANTLLVSQEIVFFTGMGQDNRFVLDETLRYVFPDVFRSDILTENIQRVHLLSPDGVLTVTDGKADWVRNTRTNLPPRYGSKRIPSPSFAWSLLANQRIRRGKSLWKYGMRTGARPGGFCTRCGLNFTKKMRWFVKFMSETLR